MVRSTAGGDDGRGEPTGRREGFRRRGRRGEVRSSGETSRCTRSQA
jgi:hypothetical protein